MGDLSEDIVAAAQKYQHLVAIEATFNGHSGLPVDKIDQALKGRDYLGWLVPTCPVLAGLAYKGSLNVDPNDFRKLSIILPIASFDDSCLASAAERVLSFAATSDADSALLKDMIAFCDGGKYTLGNIIAPEKVPKRELKQALDASCPLHKKGLGSLKGLLFEFYAAETIRNELSGIDHEIFNRVPYSNGEYGDIDIVVACDEKDFRSIHDPLNMVFIRKPKCNGRNGKGCRRVPFAHI
ncbi:hypothetical protein KY329_00275 [Candidatus Woesearchaeota archaeon]|nr:hypothetical protein [Candidatus Woesearchaeota archaeon]